MIRRSSSIIGLAISDRGIACAEVAISGDRRTVRRTATFTFPEDLSLERPETAGQALAGFLRQKRFGASRVVVGVPARWMIAMEKEVPPADEQQARATLRLQAERLAVSESGETVFDFAGKSDSNAPTRILLVGILKQQLDRLERMMDSAGMSVVAVTSTGLSVSASIRQADRDADMLVLGRNGAEMVWRQSSGVRMLRYLPFSLNGHDTPPLAPLGAELRRTVAFSNPGDRSGKSRDLLLLDGAGLAPAHIADLSERMGVKVRAGEEMSLLGVATPLRPPGESADETEPPGYFAPAISLAVVGARSDLLPFDFTHSRLRPPKVRRIGRRTILGAIAGTIAVAALISLYVSVQQYQTTLDKVNLDIKALKDDKSKLPAAQTLVDHVTFTNKYFEKRPAVLDAILQITKAFKDEEKVWVTNLVVHENGKGEMTGKAVDRDPILLLKGRLDKLPKITKVERFNVTAPTDARNREYSFSLSFVYNLAE